MSKSLIEILLAAVVIGAAVLTTQNIHRNTPTTPEVSYSQQEIPENELTKEFESDYKLIMWGEIDERDYRFDKMLEKYAALPPEARAQVEPYLKEGLSFLREGYKARGYPEGASFLEAKAKKLGLEAK